MKEVITTLGKRRDAAFVRPCDGREERDFRAGNTTIARVIVTSNFRKKEMRGCLTGICEQQNTHKKLGD